MSAYEFKLNFDKCICFSQVFNPAVRLLIAGSGESPDLTKARIDHAVRKGEWFAFLDDGTPKEKEAGTEWGGAEL